jgi:nucleoside-diphosphate-sugar epimerase
MVVTDSPKTKEALSRPNSWVDVRDIALGHVLALEKDAAGGQRIIIVAGARHVTLIYLVILTLV